MCLSFKKYNGLIFRQLTNNLIVHNNTVIKADKKFNCKKQRIRGRQQFVISLNDENPSLVI